VSSAADSRPKGCLLALVGPTAVGKSEIALWLAERLDGEIISVDSMQVYRGLDIGTAKPSKEDRARVRHHLIDIVDLAASFDAARFVHLANQAVEKILTCGRVPILCGGTGLYFKALFEGLGETPPANNILRAELEATALPELLRELAESDPETFDRIDRCNSRRVVRAIEVIRLTGKPYSLQRADWSQPSATVALCPPAFGFARPAADLRQRIDVRVDAMFQSGLVAETEALLKAGLGKNRTALQALGYRQVVEYLQGSRSLAETIALVKTRTRQFAKRQMTWFRRQLSVRWIEITPGQPVDQTVSRILKELSARKNSQHQRDYENRDEQE
jgi:tRNA dimethylallyltransferase